MKHSFYDWESKTWRNIRQAPSRNPFFWVTRKSNLSLCTNLHDIARGPGAIARRCINRDRAKFLDSKNERNGKNEPNRDLLTGGELVGRNDRLYIGRGRI